MEAVVHRSELEELQGLPGGWRKQDLDQHGECLEVAGWHVESFDWRKLEDFMQNKSSEILFFQLQVVARVQEVRALLANEELAEEKKAAARLYVA